MSCKLKISSTGGLVEFLTLGELANECGKSKDALKSLIDRGIMPDANYRTPATVSKNGDTIEGYRLYSKEFLVPRLVPYIQKNISRGKLITIEQRSEMLTMFADEREYFENK